MAESDFSRSFIGGYSSSPSHRGPGCFHEHLADQESSRFPYKKLLHMPGSATTPRRLGARDTAPLRVAFRSVDSVGSRENILSRLDGWPMRSPADASPTSSRMPAHGSGPMWIATPSSQWTSTTYSLPVSRRTNCNVRQAEKCDADLLGHDAYRRAVRGHVTCELSFQVRPARVGIGNDISLSIIHRDLIEPLGWPRSRRTAQARVWAVERRQIHGQAARSPKPGMAHLSA